MKAYRDWIIALGIPALCCLILSHSVDFIDFQAMGHTILVVLGIDAPR